MVLGEHFGVIMRVMCMLCANTGTDTHTIHHFLPQSLPHMMDIMHASQQGQAPCTSRSHVSQFPPHKTALMFASEDGHRDVVDALLSSGADKNAADKVGNCTGTERVDSGRTTINSGPAMQR